MWIRIRTIHGCGSVSGRQKSPKICQKSDENFKIKDKKVWFKFKVNFYQINTLKSH